MEIDIEAIEQEIERLKTLNAEEYLAEEIEQLKAKFEAEREAKIAELEKALEIFEEYQIEEEEDIEEDDAEEEEQIEDNNQEAQFIEG